MVETIVRRSSRTHGMPACLAATPTANPHGPAPMTSRSTDSRLISLPISIFPLVCFRLPCFPLSGSDFYDLVPTGPHTDVAHRDPGERLEAVEVGPGRPRQIGQPSGAAGGLLPARVLLIDRLDPGKRLGLCRHFLAHRPVQAIVDADRDRSKRIEDIELGNCQPRQAVHPSGIADHGCIEPATAPGTSSHRAELASQLTQPLTMRTGRFRGQRTVANASGVGL